MARNPEKITELLLIECRWRKITGTFHLTDFDPLLVVMYRVTQLIMERGGSLDRRKPREVWCRVMRELQDDNSILEHNPLIPCRFCDQAFEPVVDQKLLDLFLNWYKHHGINNLLRIHRCPICGGCIEATRFKRYSGDYHTPEPGTEENDTRWAEQLLDHHEI